MEPEKVDLFNESYCKECSKPVDQHLSWCPIGFPKDKPKLNDQWVGGSTNIRPPYYAKYKIDPWTFCIENGVDLPTGSVIKYVMRHKDKNGVEDINKAIKCLEMIKEFYYGEG